MKYYGLARNVENISEGGCCYDSGDAPGSEHKDDCLSMPLKIGTGDSAKQRKHRQYVQKIPELIDGPRVVVNQKKRNNKDKA